MIHAYRFTLRLCLALLGLYLAALAGYFAVRPQIMSWGATPAETRRPMAGDEYIPSGAVVSTRGLTIHAPIEIVWEWMAGLGQERGGFYSYTFLENLFGARMVNAAERPMGEPIRLGSRFSYYGEGPQGTYGTVDAFRPGQTFSVHGWTFYLDALDAGTTRLVVRYPFVTGDSLVGKIGYYLMFEQAHYVMESGMMLGLKSRAEQTAERSQ